MPYRAELKRPDLKGQFPCSVCGKIFCHSSSLSRHRMQAHFKSYTCTQCNQEISSNETLRSHMFRMHSISRMFMCRCCNWAFPDKTSLHIHMQSMLRNGSPGDVAVLARSSTEDGPLFDSASDVVSPQYPADLFLNQHINNNNDLHLNNNNQKNRLESSSSSAINSIFPTVLPKDSLMNGNFSSLSSSQWLAAWLANNPFAGNINLNANSAKPESVASGIDSEEAEIDMSDEQDDYDALRIDTTEEDLQDEELEEDCKTVIVNPDEHTNTDFEKKSQKRKAISPDDNTDELDEAPPMVKIKMEDTEDATNEQPSPTVSDSHTSVDSTHTRESPLKCFDCQVSKEKLSAAETKNRVYEQEIHALKSKLAQLHKVIDEKKTTNEKTMGNNLRPALPTMQATPPAFPTPLQMLSMNNAMSLMHNNALKLFFQNMMQSQANR